MWKNSSPGKVKEEQKVASLVAGSRCMRPKTERDFRSRIGAWTCAHTIEDATDPAKNEA